MQRRHDTKTFVSLTCVTCFSAAFTFVVFNDCSTLFQLLDVKMANAAMLLMTKSFIHFALYNLRYIATLVLKQFDYLSIFLQWIFNFLVWSRLYISIVIIFHIWSKMNTLLVRCCYLGCVCMSQFSLSWLLFHIIMILIIDL